MLDGCGDGDVVARLLDTERASVKCVSACRRSASLVSTTSISRGDKSIVSVPDGEVTITCQRHSEPGFIHHWIYARALHQLTFTRTQKLTAPREPLIVSPMDQRDWLRDEGHCKDIVLLQTPVSLSSANEAPSAAATVVVIVLCACTCRTSYVVDDVGGLRLSGDAKGGGDVESGSLPEVSRKRGVRDVIVPVETAESIVDVLLQSAL